MTLSGVACDCGSCRVGKGALARRAHASGVPMSHFRRATIEGGLFFFTIALANRSSDLLVRHIDRLRRFYVMIQRHHPFETIAICVLPDICTRSGDSLPVTLTFRDAGA